MVERVSDERAVEGSIPSVFFWSRSSVAERMTSIVEKATAIMRSGVRFSPRPSLRGVIGNTRTIPFC